MSLPASDCDDDTRKQCEGENESSNEGTIDPVVNKAAQQHTKAQDRKKEQSDSDLLAIDLT
ncbi:protein of unknown function (plasmid) [Shinella sp. WSC3-e]|nr:protein of unknown function [Shinella sp. WSC3-e]